MRTFLDDKFVADFETTTQTNFEHEKCVRVWCWCIWEIKTNKQKSIGYNIESFIDEISKKSSTIYFHNLKFDSTFILDNILRKKFVYDEKLSKTKTFRSLIDVTGTYYTIEIRFENQNKRKVIVKFLDSLKILITSVKSIAKSFKFETQKGEIDYNKFRPVGYVPNEKEISYIKNDCQIISQALKIFFDRGLTKMTIASDAFHDFKKDISKVYSKYFPVLSYEQDSEIRKSYKGGFVFVNPKFQGKIIENISSYDVNSLFPSVMYNELLPVGKPHIFKGKYKHDPYFPLYIQKIEVMFDLKENKIPMVQSKNFFSLITREYLTSSNNELIELSLTNIDLDLFFDSYEIKQIKYKGGYMFRGKKGIFKKYIDYWYNLKRNAPDEPQRQIAKRMLNSLYGKFGTKCEHIKMRPFIDEKNKLNLQREEPEIVEPTYTAMASFITANARKILFKGINANIENFIYCDTDSIHLTEKGKGIEIDKNILGAWKEEPFATRGMFLRAKSYIKEIDGKIHVKCAGMPDNVKDIVNFENFHKGMEFLGKIRMKKTTGGTIAENTTFTIK